MGAMNGIGSGPAVRRGEARRRPGTACMAAVALAIGAACGGGGGGGNPGGPSPPAENPFRITITAAGVATPSELVVPPGTRVLFVNNHNQRHDMTSDPHPEHTDCPPINTVGLLNPGQSRETGNLVTVRTCGFHDHENPDVPGLRGRIVVR
jgi:plastocyanin